MGGFTLNYHNLLFWQAVVANPTMEPLETLQKVGVWQSKGLGLAEFRHSSSRVSSAV